MGQRGIFHDDQGMEEFPRYYFVAKNLQKGIIPLWDPQTWCGAIPFYARYYANTYYLPLWPFFLLADLDNLNNAYWFLIIIPLFLHYLLAVFGMFIFLRKALKFNYFSSCFGALAYVYSPIFSYAYVWQQVVITQAWLPWLFTIYISLLNRQKFWKFSLAGIILAFILTAGAPYLWPLIAFIWAGIVMVSIISQWRLEKKIIKAIKPLIIVFIIIVIGAGLSAVYLFSFLDGRHYTQEHIKLTANAALSEDKGSLPPLLLSTLLIPNLFNSITGNMMNTISPVHDVAFWDANFSGGLAVSLLVLLGIILAFKIPTSNSDMVMIRRYIVIFFFLYLFSILCVLGRYTPFYRYIIGYLPGIGRLPRPIRYRFIQCFATAVLTAGGINYLISVKSWRIANYLRRWLWVYLICSFFIVIMVIVYPKHTKNEIFYEWSEQPVSSVGEYFIAKNTVGRYSQNFPVKKIRIAFDGKSSGEIRYADSHIVLPDKGVLVCNYNAPKPGWYEFDVDIPENKFLWLRQKTAEANIGFKRSGESLDIFSYDDEYNRWQKYPYLNSIWVLQKKQKITPSLLRRLIEKDAFSRPAVYPLLYWLGLSSILILSFYFLKEKRLGYFIGWVAGVELFIFCALGFYGGMFNAYEGEAFIEHRLRAKTPFKHPIVERFQDKLSKIIEGPGLRIATDRPFHDNFSRLGNYFSLMGYEMHPLEIRFKKAIESAYGLPIGWLYYFNKPQPSYVNFLSNFSVGYLMDKNPHKIFPNEKLVLLPGGEGFFVHINHGALPRVYTMDRLMIASDNEQLQQAVSGDLHKAVYVGSFQNIQLRDVDSYDGEDYISHFNNLQKVNPIYDVNFDNPNRIDLDILVTRPAMLVFSEVWYPGWKAAVDGKTTPVLRINYCQRGVWLDKGVHNVQLKFRPLIWSRGILISLGVGILLLACIILSTIKNFNIT